MEVLSSPPSLSLGLATVHVLSFVSFSFSFRSSSISHQQSGIPRCKVTPRPLSSPHRRLREKNIQIPGFKHDNLIFKCLNQPPQTVQKDLRRRRSGQLILTLKHFFILHPETPQNGHRLCMCIKPKSALKPSTTKASQNTCTGLLTSIQIVSCLSQMFRQCMQVG